MNAACPCCATGMRVTQTKTEGYALTCPACSCQAFARSPKSANALTARLEAKHDDETTDRKGKAGSESRTGTGAQTKAGKAAQDNAAGSAAGKADKPKRRGFFDGFLDG